MTTAMTTANDAVGARIEEVLVQGNLSALTPIERTEYYRRFCTSLGLDPLTQPFQYLTLNGKLVLYANRAAAEQLRKVHGVSISEPRVEYKDDLCVVTVVATDKTGRQDSDMGIVSLVNLKGEARANAILKAVTKAKRRVTLSICGLGMLDETELEDIPASAKKPPVTMPQPRKLAEDLERASFEAHHSQHGLPIPVDTETGEIQEPPKAPGLWDAFWAKTRAMGFDDEQVREFVGVDAEAFDSMDRDDLKGLLLELQETKK